MDAPSDEKLLREFLAGQKGSFELLVRRHAPELYRFVYRMTGSSAAAEDIVQETLLKVWLGGREFNPARRFRPWVFTIAANKARDHIRKRDRHKELPFEAVIDEKEESGKRYLDLLVSAEPKSTEEVGVEERRKIVRSVLAELPKQLSEVLVLAYYHHFSYKEIGEVAGIAVGTVKSRLHTALVRFGERYREAVESRTEPVEEEEE